MVMITALAITREHESGTMENLLSMPTHPVEVLVGKIIPYILVGYIQVTLILVAAHFLFKVPMLGSLILLYGAALFFIAANLAVGVTLSAIAENQRQAIQMGFFFFLPNILLSGFAFPFRGMPVWAQMDWGNFAADPFSTNRARHPVERKWCERYYAGDLADPAFYCCGADDRCEKIPANIGLKPRELLVERTVEMAAAGGHNVLALCP